MDQMKPYRLRIPAFAGYVRKQGEGAVRYNNTPAEVVRDAFARMEKKKKE